MHRLLADAGHDTPLEKASDAVYRALPACCHYRELKNALFDGSGTPAAPGLPRIRGVVLEENSKGMFIPLPGASVIWLGTQNGTLSDSSGVFTIAHPEGQDQLVVSYAGYRSDTLRISGNPELKIILATNRQLGEVTVFSKMRSTYVSGLSAVRTQVMTEKELFKAACCNLSESFETNPSVDVSYNDAVTGSKQIQLLGLSGNYTQLTLENLPGPRGLATPLGLSFVPGPWVESIQLNKGTGSVVNGFESIAGQINVELKKPEKTERLYANAYINNMGKTDLNLVLAQAVGKKWHTALLLHDDFLANRNIDFNKDGFRDWPTGNQFSALNRWKYDNGKGWMLQFGIKFLQDNRTGGETAFDPDKHRYTVERYGLGIQTDRVEGFIKTGYVFPQKKYKSIGLQLSAFQHREQAYYGRTVYDAEQKNAYANLIYQSIIGNSNHKFRTGISFSADRYTEQFNHLPFARVEQVPGGFFEYTFTPVNTFSLVAGIRADHNNLYGWFGTPRLHLRYEPIKGTTLRISAGRGQRTANIFAENRAVFVSSRQVSILGTSEGKAYGLDPEIAWNKGISVDQKLRLFHRDATLSLDYFRNDFRRQVVTDLENVRTVQFYNLQGKSFSNSFQAELNMLPLSKLELRLAYRFFDVRTTYTAGLLEKPFTAKHRAFLNLAWDHKGWKMDFTLNYTGAKRIPSVAGNPVEYHLPAYSPDYLYMNAQVSRQTGKKHPVEWYIGTENLGNFYQRNAILAAAQPFGPYFDASMIWGPVGGRLLYAGFRYKLK